MAHVIAIAKPYAEQCSWDNLKQDLGVDDIDWQYFSTIGGCWKLHNKQCGEPYKGLTAEVERRIKLATPLLEYLGTEIYKRPEPNIYMAFANVSDEAWVYIDRCVRTIDWDDQLIHEWELDEGFNNAK